MDEKGLTIARGADVPTTFQGFTRRFPAVVDAHTAMGKAVDATGPLDGKTRELVKIGVCLGMGLESATKSHARRAWQAGATREEIEQAILLGMNTAGFPRTIMTWVWAMEQLDQEERREGG